jgi:hypothetical protein
MLAETWDRSRYPSRHFPMMTRWAVTRKSANPFWSCSAGVSLRYLFATGGPDGDKMSSESIQIGR